MVYAISDHHPITLPKKKNIDPKIKEAMLARRQFFETHRIVISIDPITREGTAQIVERTSDDVD